MKHLTIGAIKFLLALNVLLASVCVSFGFCTDTFFYGVTCVNHEYTDWVTVKEATCEENGYVECYCEICGQTQVQIITAYGHEYVSEVTIEPTIYQQGEMTYTCFRCGKSYTEVLPMLEATYTVSFVSPEDDPAGEGYLLYVCDQDASNTYAEPLTFTATVVEPTCYEQGYTIYTCNEWDYSYIADYTDVVSSHNWVLISSREANCEDSGGETYICSICNDTMTTYTAPLGHDYDLTSDKCWDATCTTAGHAYGFCSRCGQLLDEDIPALGHNYVLDKKQSYDATCDEDGLLVYVCSRCGDTTKTVIGATGHEYELDEEQSVIADCGSTYVYVCSVCGDVMTEYKEGTGDHSYGEYVSDGNATCTEDGTKTRTCLVCGNTETVTDEGSATGHDYVVDTENSVAATCISDGYTTKVCSVCGDTVTETVPATGVHDYVNGVCTVCGAEDPDYDGCAGGHTYVVDDEQSYDATCEEDGLLVYVCSVCGDTVTETIPATGHTYEDGKCTVCGAEDPDYEDPRGSGGSDGGGSGDGGSDGGSSGDGGSGDGGSGDGGSDGGGSGDGDEQEEE